MVTSPGSESYLALRQALWSVVLVVTRVVESRVVEFGCTCFLFARRMSCIFVIFPESLCYFLAMSYLTRRKSCEPAVNVVDVCGSFNMIMFFFVSIIVG